MSTRVTPTPQRSDKIKPLVSEISIMNPGSEKPKEERKTNNTTFIIVRGTGDREPEYCVEDYVYNNKYIFLKYDIGNKSGIFGDFVNAKKNVSALTKFNGRNINALKSLEDTMAKKLRLFKIKETIKQELANIYIIINNIKKDSPIEPDDYRTYCSDIKKENEKINKKKIVVIGVSHGSLLVHAALIKLSYQLTSEEKQKYAKHLHIWTIGSPQYIPKDLLVNLGFSAPPDQQILNFYHVYDPYLPILSSIKWLMKIRIPDVKYLTTISGITNNWEVSHMPPKEYIYYTHSGLVLVNATSRPQGFETNVEKYFVPHMKSFSKLTYHASMFILYPVLPFKECYVLAFAHETHWHNPYFHSISRLCSPSPFQNLPITIKGGKKKKLLKTKRKIK